MESESGFARSEARLLECGGEGKAGDGGRHDVKGGRGSVGWVEQTVEDVIHLHEAAGPSVEEDEGDGVCAIGAVMHEVEGDGFGEVRLRTCMDSCGEVVVSNEILE